MALNNRQAQVKLNPSQSQMLERFQVALVAHLGHTITKGGTVLWALERGREYLLLSESQRKKVDRMVEAYR